MQLLIPKAFYDHLDEGLDLFVGCLGFKIVHQDENLVVLRAMVRTHT